MPRLPCAARASVCRAFSPSAPPVNKRQQIIQHLARRARADDGEPFVLPVGAVNRDWLPEIAARREICAELAKAFDAPLVSFQKLFDEAVKEAPETYWLADGVHPTLAGHMRMADYWLRSVPGLA